MSTTKETKPETLPRRGLVSPSQEVGVSYLTDGEWSRPDLAVIPAGITRAEWLAGQYKKRKRSPGTIRVRAGNPNS